MKEYDNPPVFQGGVCGGSISRSCEVEKKLMIRAERTTYRRVNKTNKVFDYTVSGSETKYKVAGQSHNLFPYTEILSSSSLSRALYEFAKEEGWIFTNGDLQNDGYLVDYPKKTLVIDSFGLSEEALERSAYFQHALTLNFVRGLRDIYHEENLQNMEKSFRPEAILMIERARAADIDTVAVLCAWEMRNAGYHELWRHLLGSKTGDMAIAFTRFLERFPNAHFSGEAAGQAFLQWYCDQDRINAADHDALEFMDDILLADNAENQKPFGPHSLTAIDLECLSELPNSFRYLKDLSRKILKEPKFSGFNDSINQAHFYQIMHDMNVVMVQNVPFRDKALADRVFPADDETIEV